MNERIKLLARQCGAYHKDDEGEETKIAVLIGKEVEKFAELIVRECARALDDKLANPNGASVAWCDGSDLLEHFGVEE